MHLSSRLTSTLASVASLSGSSVAAGFHCCASVFTSMIDNNRKKCWSCFPTYKPGKHTLENIRQRKHCSASVHHILHTLQSDLSGVVFKGTLAEVNLEKSEIMLSIEEKSSMASLCYSFQLEMLSSSDKTITILHNLWKPLLAGRRLYLSPWSKLVAHWIYEKPRLTDCIFETGDFGDEIRAGMRDKPKIGDDEEGSVRQDPEEWIRTLLFCDTWYWTAAQSTWKMTTTKGFVFIKSDVFIARDAGKRGGFFSLFIKNDSVNFLVYLDWFAKI